MDSDDEQYDSFDTETSSELDNAVCGARDSSFEALSAQDIVNLMNQYIDDVVSVVELPSTTTRILLSHTKWDKQELLDRLTDGDRENFFARAHVTDPFAKSKGVRKSSRKRVECSICYCEFSQKEIVGLGCSHEFCEDCWCQYLTIKIADGDADSICCPAEKCDVIVDDVKIMQLVADEKIKQKYQHLMTNSFVQYNHSLRWCPSPGCTFAIRVNRLLAYRQNCTCKCGYTFCFNCGDENHDPIPCTLLKNWKRNDNDLTVEYLTKYTKSCPKCDSLIEKNGGCNHMTCRKCGHEFCWLCFGDWNRHKSLDCTSYQATGGAENDKKRWEHYLKLYALHKKSLKYEKDLANNGIKDRIQQLQLAGISWNESQYLMKALDILWESRKQLMLMCIFAYCVQDHLQKSIFEINQSDLQTATEELSRYMEQDITTDNVEDIMLKVKNKSNYCERRSNTLKEHIYEGFENHWWNFISNL